MEAVAGCRTGVRRTISAIPGDYTQAYFVSEHAGLFQATSRHELGLYWNGPSGGNDNEQQIALVERAVQRDDFGIVLTPTAPFALDTVIERALSRKIPVVILSAPISLPADPNLSFVLNDFQRSGLLAAERVHLLIGDKGEVAIAGVDALSPGNAACADAFESRLREIAPHVRIVSSLRGAFTPGQAEAALEELLEQHPEISAIYSLNIEVTHGAVAAIRESHRERPVTLIGNDQALDLMFLVRTRIIDSLVIQDMRGMGEEAVENIVALRDGRKTKPVSVHEPVLLTGDNIDTEVMQQRLKMDWRPTS
jgi:ribose transport system substrate-binding protein